MNKENNTSSNGDVPHDFVPWGAFAFLISLAVLCFAIWFGVYYLMVGRS